MGNYKIVFFYLSLACLQGTTEAIVNIEQSTEPILMTTETLDVDKKNDVYLPNFYQGNLGNNIQDSNQLYPNDWGNTFNVENRPNYPYSGTDNTYGQQFQGTQPANPYYLPQNRPDVGFSNGNFNGQYPNQDFGWGRLPIQPNQNGFANQGLPNDYGFANQRRPEQNEFYNTGRPSQTVFLNTGRPNLTALPNSGRSDQAGFINAGRPEQNLYMGRPNQNYFYNQGGPVNTGNLNQVQPDRMDFSSERPLNYQNQGFLWADPNQNGVSNQAYQNLGQYNNFNPINWNSGNGLRQDTFSRQPIRYSDQDLTNNIGKTDGTPNQNGTRTEDDNVATIISLPVVIPQTMVSSDQIFFPEP